MALDSPPPEPGGRRDPDGVATGGQLEHLMAMVARVQPEFDRRLERIAQSGLAALPTADGVGVAVLDEGRLDHLAGTGDLVAAVDDAQYGLMQGPCVTAAREQRTVVTASLAAEPRWSELSTEIAQLDVRSILSVPLVLEEQLLGTLNIYARRDDAFDADARSRAEQYALTAAAALQQACVLRRAQQVADQVSTGIQARTTVNRTVGLLMAQDGVEAAEALATLTATAEARGVALASVAQQVWDERLPLASLAPSDEAAWSLRR